MLLTALITSLNDINATNIHVNAMRIMTYTASASTTPRGRLLGNGMILLAMGCADQESQNQGIDELRSVEGLQ